LDPLSTIIGQELATAYTLNGDTTSAINQAKRTIELDPNFPIAYEALGIAYFKSQDYPAAIEAFQKEAQLSGRSSSALASLAFMYGLTAKRREATAILNELNRMYQERRCPEMYVAMVYTGLGDKDQAFAWLQKGVSAHGTLLSYMTWDPRVDSLRDDPRYETFLRSIRLK
jgi:tetratricopeptide (TPR) repeat protein